MPNPEPERASDPPRAKRPGSSSVRHLATLVLAGLLVAWAGVFAYQLLPFVRYPFEADPSDGDMLNALLRGLGGEPIYGDWRTGTVTLLYPPLFLGVLALARALGQDPIVFFRGANLACFLASLVLVVVVASKDGDGRGRTAESGILAGLFLLAAWEPYFWLAPVHPAALLLVISLLTCTLLAHRPSATIGLALLCSLAVLAKQSGIGLLLGVLCHLAFSDRRRLPRFLLASVLLLGLAAAAFELQSRGQFLRSVLIYPSRVFTGAWVSWDHAFQIAAGYYGPRLWMLPLIGVGLMAARRTRMLPLAVVFVVDAATSLILARSVAGSPSYLWFHYALACILAAQGFAWLWQQAAVRLRWLADRRVLSLLGLVLGGLCVATDGRDLLDWPRRDLSRATEVSRQHAALVTGLIAAHPGEKWLATRSSLAVVRAGAVLDQEYATFSIAWTHANLVDRAAVRRRVATGEYGFAQLAPTALTFDPLADVFAACFAPVARSTLVFMGRPAPATLLRYDGTRTRCRDLRP
jgi:hypothetical protein